MPDRPSPRLIAPGSENSPYRQVVIAGGGLIGLSIALELHERGVASTVLETGGAMAQASTAAAGMLAAEDPHNPPELQELSHYSLGLYPEFLTRIEHLSGLSVPIQTKVTIQHSRSGVDRLKEESLDPRQLGTALLEAVRRAGIDLREHCCMVGTAELEGHTLVLAAGAWSGSGTFGLRLPVVPRKGQMLRVALPAALHDLREVHRGEGIYIVPRTQGLQAGSALIGATVENAGFDTSTHVAELARLRALAAEILPAVADENAAPEIESWAGLRPATPDGLPLIGRIGETFVATGHFRNGILLAPATAAIIADLIELKDPAMPLDVFRPDRFSA